MCAFVIFFPIKKESILDKEKVNPFPFFFYFFFIWNFDSSLFRTKTQLQTVEGVELLSFSQNFKMWVWEYVYGLCPYRAFSCDSATVCVIVNNFIFLSLWVTTPWWRRDPEVCVMTISIFYLAAHYIHVCTSSVWCNPSAV